MNLMRATMIVAAVAGVMSGGLACTATAAAVSAGEPMTGLLPREEETVGRLVQRNGAWVLRRQGKDIALDVSSVAGQRLLRLEGERVRADGVYVFAGLGRTFIVTRIRRA